MIKIFVKYYHTVLLPLYILLFLKYNISVRGLRPHKTKTHHADKTLFRLMKTRGRMEDFGMSCQVFKIPVNNLRTRIKV